MIIPSEYRQAAAQRKHAMATRIDSTDAVRVYTTAEGLPWDVKLERFLPTGSIR